MSNLEQFRSSTREWLKENCPSSCQGPDNSLPDIIWGGRLQEYPDPDVKDWMEKLVGKGWTVPTWPEKYGGAGLSKEEEKVLREEMNAIGTYSPRGFRRGDPYEICHRVCTINAQLLVS